MSPSRYEARVIDGAGLLRADRHLLRRFYQLIPHADGVIVALKEARTTTRTP
jgi:hypothetical protein